MGGGLDFAAFDSFFQASGDALARLPGIRALGFRAAIEAQARLLVELVPDHGVWWPAADPGDSLYQQDYRHYMRLEEGGGHHMMSMPMKMSAHEHPSHARH